MPLDANRFYALIATSSIAVPLSFAPPQQWTLDDEALKRAGADELDVTLRVTDLLEPRFSQLASGRVRPRGYTVVHGIERDKGMKSVLKKAVPGGRSDEYVERLIPAQRAIARFRDGFGSIGEYRRALDEFSSAYRDIRDHLLSIFKGTLRIAEELSRRSDGVKIAMLVGIGDVDDPMGIKTAREQLEALTEISTVLIPPAFTKSNIFRFNVDGVKIGLKFSPDAYALVPEPVKVPLITGEQVELGPALAPVEKKSGAIDDVSLYLTFDDLMLARRSDALKASYIVSKLRLSLTQLYAYCSLVGSPLGFLQLDVIGVVDGSRMSPVLVPIYCDVSEYRRHALFSVLIERAVVLASRLGFEVELPARAFDEEGREYELSGDLTNAYLFPDVVPIGRVERQGRSAVFKACDATVELDVLKLLAEAIDDPSLSRAIATARLI